MGAEVRSGCIVRAAAQESAERSSRLDDLMAAADILAAAQAERRTAQRELDAAIARERDAALRCMELRALAGSY